MVKVDPDEIDMQIAKTEYVREFVIKTLLYLAIGNVNEAADYLEAALSHNHDVKKYLEKLKSEAIEEFEKERKEGR